jgi:hypothetical protein
MDTDGLLKRVRAISGVIEASIMHGRQRERLYVKVAAGDANPVNRRVHPLLVQYPDLGLRYEYEQAEPCGAALWTIRRHGPGDIEPNVSITHWSKRPRMTSQ